MLVGITAAVTCKIPHFPDVSHRTTLLFFLKGYRTLCFAKRSIDEDEYERWNKDFEKASVAIEGREQRLAECMERMERDLTLVGISAVEDKLQEVLNKDS